MELTTKFDELMNKSPIIGTEVNGYLKEMKKTSSGTLITTKLIGKRIQSSSEAQAIHAFNLLEAFLSSEGEGSIEFRTEVGRFRFLNEIIRILSPKYMGDSTLPSVKERAIKFLEDASGPKRKSWFPSQNSKIQAAYQSLVDGGVIIIKQKSPVDEEEAELEKNVFDRRENARILKNLIQSTDPRDIQAANRLIKNLVEQEGKRVERRAELHSLIDRIDTSASLLGEVLDQSVLDEEIVGELVETCKTLRQKLGGVATETGDETNALLQASEKLEQVLELYEDKKRMPKKEDKDKKKKTSISITDELLLQLDLGTMTIAKDKEEEEGMSLADHLLDMMPSLKTKEQDDDLLLNLDIDLSLPNPKTNLVKIVSQEDQKKKMNPLDEIGRLNKQLMEEFGNRNHKKDKQDEVAVIVPNPNVLSMSTTPTAPSIDNQQRAPQPLLDLALFDDLPKNKKTTTTTESSSDLLLNVNAPTPTTLTSSPKSEHVRQFVNSIKTIDLDRIEDVLSPLDLKLDDGGKVNLTISFAKMPDYPKEVKVGIITCTNQSTSSDLCNYVFQLIPPKGFQVKLLAPTSMELPAWKKTFLPQPMLTQVALIIIPDLSCSSPLIKTKFKYILSYSKDDDTALHNGEFELPF